MMNHESALDFIIEYRQAGLTLLNSIKGYSSILRKKGVGKVSDFHGKKLRVISDCCEIPWEKWIALTELIDHNEPENAIAILRETDETGKSNIQRNFIDKAIQSLEIVIAESTALLKEPQLLSNEHLKYVEIIKNDCRREIEIWKEMASHFS